MAPTEPTTGVILQMQDYSIHDGDGVRTTIFLAGCGLRCQWCANPESWTRQPKLAFHAHKCAACHRCAGACREGLDPAAADFAPSRCTHCGDCVAACPERALQLAGLEQDLKAVVDKIRRDEIFFRHSGGGVTLSGGEPFRQPRFARALLDACDALGVSVWAETCGVFDWEACGEMIPRFEHIFFDIKHMDDEAHRRFTGQGNHAILENARRIHRTGVPMTIRVPVIAEVNLSDANLRATAEFVAAHLPGATVELLPYHELGKAKYLAFRMAESFHAFSPPTPKQLARAYEIFASRKIERYA